MGSEGWGAAKALELKGSMLLTPNMLRSLIRSRRVIICLLADM